MQPETQEFYFTVDINMLLSLSFGIASFDNYYLQHNLNGIILITIPVSFYGEGYIFEILVKNSRYVSINAKIHYGNYKQN